MNKEKQTEKRMYSNEIWKDIEGFEGYYQISNKARVKSLKRIVNGKGNKPNTVPEKILKQFIVRGYLKVTLQKNKITKPVFVHRILYCTFLNKNYNNLTMQINHIDGNKLNNNLINLEWVTCQENRIHAVDNNLINPNKGEECYNSKLTDIDVKNIRKEYIGYWGQLRILSEKYNVHKMTIYNIIKQKTWRHI